MTGQDARGVAARMQVVQGDITRLEVDAVVNAANDRLLPGGGVCGAIHAMAGPELEAACRKIGHCPTSEAVLTPGFALPARFVLHAVGPVWGGGARGEDELLASCYRRSLELAAAHGLKSVAFPAISTGIYGFPADRAAGIAVGAVAEALRAMPGIEVTFCCYSAESTALHAAALARSGSAAEGGAA